MCKVDNLPALQGSSTTKTERQALNCVVFGVETCVPPHRGQKMRRQISNKVAFWVDIRVLANCSYPVFALHSVITHKTTRWMLFKHYFQQQSLLSIKNSHF